MIRLTRILENTNTIILKFEGGLEKSEEIDWAEIWKELKIDTEKTLVIDFCESSFLNPVAVDGIRQIIVQDTILLNCPEILVPKLLDDKL
ncbi:MAG: hypothetical protein GF372_06760 [Candidatus Marinimicrobia bacterium]|nr:hypothetical protein [Candidatus Neomarinimicrobiota bacterium]